MYNETDSIKYSAEEREEFRKLMADLRAERGALRARHNATERAIAELCEAIVREIEEDKVYTAKQARSLYRRMSPLTHDYHRLSRAIAAKNNMIGKIRAELNG